MSPYWGKICDWVWKTAQCVRGVHNCIFLRPPQAWEKVWFFGFFLNYFSISAPPRKRGLSEQEIQRMALVNQVGRRQRKAALRQQRARQPLHSNASTSKFIPHAVYSNQFSPSHMPYYFPMYPPIVFAPYSSGGLWICRFVREWTYEHLTAGTRLFNVANKQSLNVSPLFKKLWSTNERIANYLVTIQSTSKFFKKNKFPDDFAWL